MVSAEINDIINTIKNNQKVINQKDNIKGNFGKFINRKHRKKIYKNI